MTEISVNQFLDGVHDTEVVSKKKTAAPEATNWPSTQSEITHTRRHCSIGP